MGNVEESGSRGSLVIGPTIRTTPAAGVSRSLGAGRASGRQGLRPGHGSRPELRLQPLVPLHLPGNLRRRRRLAAATTIRERRSISCCANAEAGLRRLRHATSGRAESSCRFRLRRRGRKNSPGRRSHDVRAAQSVRGAQGSRPSNDTGLCRQGSGARAHRVRRDPPGTCMADRGASIRAVPGSNGHLRAAVAYRPVALGTSSCQPSGSRSGER